jgi:hypothetical protein
MVSDFRWIDFDIMDDIADEIDRIYSLGGFKNQDIKQIKDYFKKRVNALRKFIPPEQLQKKKAINIVPKPVKEEVKEDIIRIHIYDNKEETDNIERNALYEEDDDE